MTFLEKLEMLMKYRGLNKRQLSEGSGIPYSTIDNFWKKGCDNIKLSNLIKLASYFEVSLDFLVRDISESSTEASLSVNDTVRKYLGLDEYGRAFVDFVVDREYQRCKDSTTSGN